MKASEEVLAASFLEGDKEAAGLQGFQRDINTSEEVLAARSLEEEKEAAGQQDF